MANVKPVRIFIASSNELMDERKLCIQIITQLNESHKHLHLKPVEWEISMVHSNYPEHENIQDAIDPKLKESDLVVFIFYSKIGKYTREEFDFANKEKKRLFAFFKTGFSPEEDDHFESYKELKQFKKSLNDTVFYKEYDDLDNFEKLFYPNLNLYLTENHPSEIDETERASVTALSQTVQQLIHTLAVKDEEIKILRENTNQLPDANLQIQINELLQEKDAIRNELLRSEEVKNKLAKEKQSLEKQLAPQIEKDALKGKAFEEVKKGNYAEAENYLKESVKASVDDTASTFFELAKIKKLQFKYSEGLHYYELAAKIAPDNSRYIYETGSMLYELGFYDKAMVSYEKALAIDIKIYGLSHPNISKHYNNIGLIYDRLGQYDQAIEYYEKSLEIDKIFLGDEHSEIATLYNNIGLAFKQKKEYNKAIEYYEMALVTSKKFLGEEHFIVGSEYNNIGATYRAKGDYDKAIEYGEKALAIFKVNFGEEHPRIAIAQNNIGFAYADKGEYEEAIELLEKALGISKKFFGEEHPSIAVRYNNIGSVYLDKGDYEKAIEFCKKALNIFLIFLPESHPTAQIIISNILSAEKKV